MKVIVKCKNHKNQEVALKEIFGGYICPLCEQNDRQKSYYIDHEFVRYDEGDAETIPATNNWINNQ